MSGTWCDRCGDHEPDGCPHQPPVFKWTVEIEVHENLVADGLILDERKMYSILTRACPYAYESEFKVRVLKAPSDKALRAVGAVVFPSRAKASR